jgi:hypothetical protein
MGKKTNLIVPHRLDDQLHAAGEHNHTGALRGKLSVSTVAAQHNFGRVKRREEKTREREDRRAPLRAQHKTGT